MGTPFPGMDPYLEDRHLWPSVHHRLISVISDMLTAQVAPHFYVTIEERITISGPEEGDELTQAIPDLYLVQRPTLESIQTTAQARPTAPTIVEPLAPLEVRDRYIEVRDSAGQAVVTTLELLSPPNKATGTSGRRAFLAKRHAVMGSATHWIEIDLLRAGERPDEIAHPCDYYALLKRQGHSDRLEVWFVDLRDPLPIIAVPLRPPFADALLDLGAAVADVYERGTYAARIDYQQPAPPLRLRPADVTWAAHCIAAWQQ